MHLQLQRALCTKGIKARIALWLAQERDPDDQLTNEKKERSPQHQKSQRPGRDRVAKPPESSRSLLNLKAISCLLNVCWNWRISLALRGNTACADKRKGHVLRLRSVISLDIRIVISQTLAYMIWCSTMSH